MAHEFTDRTSQRAEIPPPEEAALRAAPPPENVSNQRKMHIYVCKRRNFVNFSPPADCESTPFAIKRTLTLNGHQIPE